MLSEPIEGTAGALSDALYLSPHSLLPNMQCIFSDLYRKIFALILRIL